MKRLLIVMLIISFISCNKETEQLHNTTGELNHLTIIMDDVLWKGEIGDSLRKKFAAPSVGIACEEPIFNLTHYNYSNTDNEICTFRNILFIDFSDDLYFEIKKNEFAQKQNTIYISGSSQENILNLLQTNSDSIINFIKKTEVIESFDRYFSKPKYEKKFGKIKLLIPNEFINGIDQKDFFWTRKEIPSGTANLLLYEIPWVSNKIKDPLNHILNHRDSIGKKYIQSKDKVLKGSMTTERNYSPNFNQTTFNNKTVYETRGTWEIKDALMNGPFINFAIPDNKNKKALILEGFIYAPYAAKRDVLLELEAIIKSIQIQ